MRVGVLVVTGWLALCVFGCKEKKPTEASAGGGLDALTSSRFYCRAAVVPNATTNAGLGTQGGDPIYFYGECFPNETRCRNQGADVTCFEQPVAFCYKESVTGSGSKVYTLCLSSAHVCADWRKTRMRDMGDRVQSDCEMIVSSQFIE